MPHAEMPRVIFTVFAGRRRFMNVLMMYVHPLLTNTVDQVDIWDYCRTASDREYVQTLDGKPDRRVRVVTPPASDANAKFPNKWKGYYKHYARTLAADDLLVKCAVYPLLCPVLARLLAGGADADGARRGGLSLLHVAAIWDNDRAMRALARRPVPPVQNPRGGGASIRNPTQGGTPANGKRSGARQRRGEQSNRRRKRPPGRRRRRNRARRRGRRTRRRLTHASRSC